MKKIGAKVGQEVQVITKLNLRKKKCIEQKLYGRK